MSVSYTWDLQAYISGAWTSIKRDVEVFKTPTVVTRGIDGSGITNRVASPGSLTASLDNSEANSGAKLGYYSPGHANMRANFGRDTRVRLKITYSGTDYYKFHGWIMDLKPSPGQYRDRSSMLIAADYMQKLIEKRLDLLPVQENKRSDQVITTILAAMPTAPLNSSIDTDTFEMPFALSAEMDERTTPMGVIQKICQTVLGYFFVKGNTTDGETVVFQKESSRAKKTSSATLTNTMTTMEVKRPTDTVKNKVIGKIHPIEEDTEATTLIYEIDSDIFVDAGDTQTFTFRFKDPRNRTTRISALDVVTPLVAGTHYRASRNQDTDFDDANGDITITDTNGANSAEWEIQNTVGYRVFINLVNIFGRGIYYHNPVEVVKESGDGDRDVTYNFFYMSDIYRARSFLYRLHARASSTASEVERLSFYADSDATLMGYALSLDIGDRVTLTESVTGVSGQYTINKVTYTLETNGALRVDWSFEPADTNTYFTLDSSLLDGPDVLSPY